jgi:hypothetical protein
LTTPLCSAKSPLYVHAVNFSAPSTVTVVWYYCDSSTLLSGNACVMKKADLLTARPHVHCCRALAGQICQPGGVTGSHKINDRKENTVEQMHRVKEGASSTIDVVTSNCVETSRLC